MENATDNAQYIYNFMIRNGASQNAALAVLGNMYAESTCNPGIWQNLDSSRTDLGFGLVQWTPSTKYINWAAADPLRKKRRDPVAEKNHINVICGILELRRKPGNAGRII